METIKENASIEKSKNNSLERELDLLKQNLNKNIEENKEHYESISQQRKRITDLENENLKLQGSVADERLQSERNQRLVDYLQGQVDSLKNEAFKTKSDNEAGSYAHQRTTTLYENS